MAVTSSISRRVLGGEIEPALRPVLLVTLLHALATSARVSFLAIWAIRELHASSAAVGITFTLAALVAIVTGLAGGHLSDHIGRRPLILASSGGQAVIAAGLVLNGDAHLTGLALMVLGGGVEAVGMAADQAILTDLVPPEARERAFAAARVVLNLGFVGGPPVGALLLLGGWTTLFAGTAAMAAVAFAAGYRLLPERGAHAPERPPERGSWRVLAADRRFLVVFLAGCLAAVVYLSAETLLPISVTDGHGVDPSVWGAILIVNPLLVTVLQLRVTGWVIGVPLPRKLAVAMLAMGLPFMALSVSAAIPVLVLLICVFVLGEMLWAPAMQSLTTAIAPDDLRGAYLGAQGTVFPVAFAVGPLLGLSVRDAWGDDVMWVVVAAISVVAAALYVLAARVVRVGE